MLSNSVYADATIPELISQAQTALLKGQSQQAAEFYEQAAALGESPEAEIGLVRAYLQSGEFDKAIAFANLVAAEHADVSETAAMLAYLEDREGHTNVALDKLAEELKKLPNDVALVGANAEILLDRMGIPQAIKFLDEWISRNPPHGDIYRLRARAAYLAGNRADFIAWRSKAFFAYQQQQQLTQAKTLQTWLEKHDAGFDANKSAVSMSNEQSATASAALQSQKSSWPPQYLEAFPITANSEAKTGNGFIIDQGRYIVTNLSLVETAQGEILVRNGLGHIAKARLDKVFPEQGIALLKLQQPYAKTSSLPKINVNRLNNLHHCFSLGYPITEPLETSYPILVPNIVVRADIGIGNIMQISSAINTNNSASPIFDIQGNFIGLTLSNNDISKNHSELAKGNFALRADALKNLLPKGSVLKKTSKLDKRTSLPSIEVLYQKLLPAVVSIVVSD